LLVLQEGPVLRRVDGDEDGGAVDLTMAAVMPLDLSSIQTSKDQKESKVAPA